jgi:hypothetical protein
MNMARYCFTYDAKDALSWDPEELILKISEIILNNTGLYLENPVPNTILFEDGNVQPNLGFWNGIFLKNLKEDVYYYLGVIAKTGKGEYSESNEGDPDLDADYQELLEDLEAPED